MGRGRFGEQAAATCRGDRANGCFSRAPSVTRGRAPSCAPLLTRTQANQEDVAVATKQGGEGCLPVEVRRGRLGGGVGGQCRGMSVVGLRGGAQAGPADVQQGYILHELRGVQLSWGGKQSGRNLPLLDRAAGGARQRRPRTLGGSRSGGDDRLP